MSMIVFWRRFHSSVDLPPPLQQHAGARATWTTVPIVGKKLGWVSWLPARPEASQVDALCLGDSYADDVDMGYACWPYALARRRGWSLLNAARGGSIAGQGIDQYDRAVAFAHKECLRVSPSTVCIVHLGGNNLLHALWLGPLALALLFFDIAYIGLGLAGVTHRITRLPRFSFAGQLARRVQADLGTLLQHLGGKGHTHVLVAGMPVCAAVPTMRVVVGLFLWPLSLWPTSLLDVSVRGRPTLYSRAVGAVAADFARLTQVAIHEHLIALASAARIELTFFDEAAAVMDVAEEMRRNGSSMFRDGHHPNEAAHARIAALAERLVDGHAAATRASRQPRRARSPAQGRMP